MATPILADVRRYFPNAEITAMCQKPMEEIVEKDPHVNEIFSFTKLGKMSRREGQRDLIQKLRGGKYDLGILLTNSFSSAWLMAQGRVKERIGFVGNWRRWLLTKPIPKPKERGSEHLVTTYKRLLVPLGVSISETEPQLFVTDEERAHVRKLLDRFDVPEGAKIIGIHPGAAYGEAKCWLPDRFHEVTKQLLEKDPNCYVLFLGSVGQSELIKGICDGLPARAINMAGVTTLREMMALISQLEVLLTNDSGPMHVASAVGVKLVALFGSTNSTATGPYNGGTVINKDVSCSPCYKRVCPIDFRCMKQITVEEVVDAITR
ncbi:MAG: lipopolysaccharide heptosyltransferase II [Candidatus Algichlamydia australiensis]|nr:lipopolysaccharide heptosyltransferase II [Chlamydiales bacterium]